MHKNSKLFDRTDLLPREKIETLGSSHLTDAELLAIILRTGVSGVGVIELSTNILSQLGGLRCVINAPKEQLLKVKGLGPAKISSLLALKEMFARLTTVENIRNRKISSPKDVFEVVRSRLMNQEVEHLYLLNLDTRNNLISLDLLTIGTVNQTLVSCREIFRMALLKGAVSIILVHNHPSNDPTPSSEDISLTKILAEFGKGLGINLIDHVVVSDSEFISIKSMFQLDSAKGQRDDEENFGNKSLHNNQEIRSQDRVHIPINSYNKSFSHKFVYKQALL
ncbi:DNA repair protein RadC [Candidatus Nomurabacteria bacterium]|uniref:DNA repair protein RadC n=1 Tax=candidate division WWE3 bacterium TaxID=2053526 RepID=A0A955DZX8_UNCKA|nr:DNA repair protein RadC [candidate division WWE3 bacterium]MCB9823751.1 DNA repair protein RadC [Candidatus Nomurabacteria bacterium]MCB9826843.1 DNA repair protein RadC [Candidatus Nomurabacteria bacterium]MCB9827546.1 DNA repair protein RadC [Candidatus Nomurabacteria bacterium]HXK52429.1 DNA repair protein RadC [bacterium]